MKALELKLIAELMKDSRRSDRELAKAVGSSQPTVSRTIRKLVKEGYIKEFTIIPDFRKLDFQMLSIIFARLKQGYSMKDLEDIRVRIREKDKLTPIPSIMGMSGIGLDSDRVIMIFHKTFADYMRFMDSLKRHPLIEIMHLKSFTISLAESHFQPLSFSNLARYLQCATEEEAT